MNKEIKSAPSERFFILMNLPPDRRLSRPGLAREKADHELTLFFIIITFSLPGIFDGCAKVFHEAYIFIGAPFGDADLAGEFGRCAGAFDPDKMVDPGESLKDLFLH